MSQNETYPFELAKIKMAAIAFNLRKYMKLEPVKVKSMAIALKRELVQTFKGLFLFHISFFLMKILKTRSRII